MANDFLRPEVRALLWRWRDLLGALAVVALGLWWGLRGSGIVQWLGYLLIAGGGIWAIAGVQRGRFHQDGHGPGVVQITERRLSYFGPLDGGVMDVGDVIRLEFDPDGYPAPHWVLHAGAGQRLAIPVNAAGADDLFDVFGALPGMRTRAVLDVLADPPDAAVVVWEKTPSLLH